MNDTLRLRALNKLIDMDQDEKIGHVENIKKTAVYLKDDISTQSKRNKIYVKLIIDEVELSEYEAIVDKIEDLDDSNRLKLLNKWYNLDTMDRKKKIYKMLGR